MTKKETEKKETDFQGPVSLDAIFAATQGKTTEIDKEKNKLPIEPVIKEEVIVDPVTPIEPAKPIEEEVIPPVNTEETEAFKTAKRLISLGLLEDFSIQTSEEDENGTAISEFISMTDENLEEIVKIHNQEKNKEISSNYIPKGDLKEHQLKVFEILSNGGDLSQIAESPEKALERPFENYDMEDQQRQVDVLYTDLTSGKGLKHERAIDLIKISVEKGTIAAEAQEVFDLYRDAHTKYIDNMLAEQKKEKEFKDLNFKENKKALTAKLKEVGLKESVYKKVASEYAKKNENGEHALIDKLKEALSNPEENHELILHLSDKKLFNETFKIKASQEAQKTIVKLASGAASKGNRQSTKTQTNDVQAPWLKIAQMHNENIKKK